MLAAFDEQDEEYARAGRVERDRWQIETVNFLVSSKCALLVVSGSELGIGNHPFFVCAESSKVILHESCVSV